MDIQGEKIKCLSNFQAPELVVGKIYTAGITRKNVHGVWQVVVEGKWYIHDRFELVSKEQPQGVPPSHIALGDELAAVDATSTSVSTEQDFVNSPKHYAFFDGVEAIEIIASSMSVEAFRGYCMGCNLKYRLRAGKKDDLQQDISKAEKYKELFENYKHLCQVK